MHVAGRWARVRDPRVHKLCRFLGFGLLGVWSSGFVEVLIEPKPWRPRQDTRRRARLIHEHRTRHGDPAPGGSTRSPIMTAYRQQALACAAFLVGGPRRTRDIRSAIPNASTILLRNVYGWFTRVQRGVYTLTPEGASALARWPQHVMPAVTSVSSRLTPECSTVSIVPFRPELTMHEGDTPPASTIAAAVTRFEQRSRRHYFYPTIKASFSPTIVVRPAPTGETNTFCSAFETDRHAE